MDFSQFGNRFQAKEAQFKHYFANEAPQIVVKTVYRFLDDNFRLQGWQGSSLQPWKANKTKTTILIKNGDLRRGFNHSVVGSQILFHNNVPYAAVHNLGLNIKATAKISEHKRRMFYTDEVSAPRSKKKLYSKTLIGGSIVKEHERKIDFTMPQRQFAPTDDSPSPILEKMIAEQFEQDIYNLLKF